MQLKETLIPKSILCFFSLLKQKHPTGSKVRPTQQPKNGQCLFLKDQCQESPGSANHTLV